MPVTRLLSLGVAFTDESSYTAVGWPSQRLSDLVIRTLQGLLQGRGIGTAGVEDHG